MTRTGARLGLAAALWLGAAAAAAQTPFALQALGQNVETGTARDTGRGGWGMADGDTLTPSTLNPAALADLRFTALWFSGYGTTTNTSGAVAARTTRRVLLPNVRLAVPLERGRLALHAGFNIRRSLQYQTLVDIASDHFGEPVSGYERYNRDGTMYDVPVGLAWRATGGLSLGATLNLVRGSIDETITQVFTDPLGNYYLPNTRDQLDKLSGQSVTASVLADGLGFVKVGASYTPAYDLEFDRRIGVGGVAAKDDERFTCGMPAEYKAGLLVALGRGWRFGADGQLMRYSEFAGRPDWAPSLRDEWTVATGFERRWSRNPQGRGYTLPLRCGFSWRRWAHTIAGEPLDERMISIGTGVPFRDRLGMIDVSLSYSWIGDEADHGYRCRSWRLGVSLTGLEPLIF
ncbi:MAG TPA: hypothetical protein PLL30_13115 [Candidatus Krumholzibacteria bacterium]|nr:hypothetical protein [Candidatus Krumholzibacteria bacterium]HPD72710.1 hypothetical protein [Candidatus Krumholzibacteria bacterium]HRY40358.1 hypothetical protein [Candidatus Krumholzibacteria bacterium]